MNDDLDDDMNFDEFEQSGSSPGMSQSPMVKIGLVAAAVVVVIAAVMIFGGKSEDPSLSMVQEGSEFTQTPGAAGEVSPAYQEAVEQQNEDDLENAILQGTSALPVPIGNQNNVRLDVPDVQAEEDDPLHRWRVLQEARKERELEDSGITAEPVTVLNAEQQSEAINNLSGAMLQQMESVLSANSDNVSFTTRSLISASTGGDGATASGAGAAAGSDEATNEFTDQTEETIVLPAGKIVYGQLLLEANSDVPSTVLAQMVSGPLKGWKLLGEFEVQEDTNLLSITFNIAVNEDGDQYDIEAVMLNPNTSLAAMRTSVNHRYLQRVVFPAAAAFVEGFASAVAESGRTSVTVTGETVVEDEQETTNDQEVATGVEEAAAEVSEILDDLGDVPVKIVIASGTPIGIFFTQNVVDAQDDL